MYLSSHFINDYKNNILANGDVSLWASAMRLLSVVLAYSCTSALLCCYLSESGLMFPQAATAASRTSGTSQRASGTASLCSEPGDAWAPRASPPLRSLSESGDELNPPYSMLLKNHTPIYQPNKILLLKIGFS